MPIVFSAYFRRFQPLFLSLWCWRWQTVYAGCREPFLALRSAVAEVCQHDWQSIKFRAMRAAAQEGHCSLALMVCCAAENVVSGISQGPMRDHILAFFVLVEPVLYKIQDGVATMQII